VPSAVKKQVNRRENTRVFAESTEKIEVNFFFQNEIMGTQMTRI
jgi:hypothetical protein